MPKRTIAQICRNHGISRDIWQSAKTNGINVWNDDDMAAYLASRRDRIKPNASLPAKSDEQPPDESPAQTLERIERELRLATVSSEVKILKDKLDGLKRAVEVRRMSGDLIAVGEVKDSIVKVVSAARGELLKAASDLPPQLEGLPAAKIQVILRNAVTAILGRLSDECSTLY